MKAKKWISVLCACSMLAAVTGCSGETSSSSAEADSSQAQASASSWNVERPEGLPEDYPNKELTFIYPFGAGNSSEVYMRVIFEKVKEMEGWDYSIVVQNVEGAGGDIGWSQFMQAEPDGYTLTFAPSSQQVTAITNGKDYTADNLEYLANFMTDPGVIYVKSDSPYNTLEDLLNAAKENPNTISVGLTAPNGGEGLAMRQLQEASGAQLNVVPFSSGPEIFTAVAGGFCVAGNGNVGDITTFLEEGSIKVLATGGRERSAFLPDVPTYQESGYDVVQENSRAIVTNKGTDPAIVQYLSDCFVAAANDPEVQEATAQMNIPLDVMGREECTEAFTEYYETVLALWEEEPWA